jgi:hypothetical protein
MSARLVGRRHLLAREPPGCRLPPPRCRLVPPHFQLNEEDRGKYLAIQFDGVATHATVYVNGHLLHRNFCGYTPFTIDISDVANFGEDT